MNLAGGFWWCTISRGDGAERQSSYCLACSGSLWAGVEFHPPDSRHTVQIHQPFQRGNSKPAMQLREGASLWKTLNCPIISPFKVFITAEWINDQVILHGKRKVTVWCFLQSESSTHHILLKHSIWKHCSPKNTWQCLCMAVCSCRRAEVGVKEREEKKKPLHYATYKSHK